MTRGAKCGVFLLQITGGSTDGFDAPFRGFTIEPHETRFLADGGFGNGAGLSNFVGAMRFRSVVSLDDEPAIDDPAGQLEVESFVVAERGEFGSRGTSRQEVAAIPASEYTLEEMTFVGVRHESPTYTNVGITNLHPDAVGEVLRAVPVPRSDRGRRAAAVVAADSHPRSGQRRTPRHVYPEWAIGDGAPARTTPWVAYASTVDGYTGDAFSGTRVPAASRVRQ